MPEYHAYTWPHMAMTEISTSALSQINAHQLEINIRHRKSATLL